MNFDAYARRRAQALLEELTSHTAETAKTELDALRSAIDARIVALDEALLHPDRARLFERLVQDLSSAAREHAEGIALRVRLDVEQAAEADLAAVRADGQSQLAAAQAAAAAQASTADDLQQQIKAAQVEVDRNRVQFEARLKELEAQLKEAEAARDETQAAHAQLTSALADARKDLDAARSDAQAKASGLGDEQARVRALEREVAEILLTRDEARAHLKAETTRAGELAQSLEASRQEVSLARAESDGRRRDLEAVSDRIRALEEIRMQLDADMLERARAQERRRQQEVTLLDRLGTALHSMNSAANASQIVEVILAELGLHFARAAVFLVGPSSFTQWRSRSVGPTADITNVAITPPIEALLRRALAERKAVTVSGDDRGAPFGSSSGPATSGIALPVLASGRVMAVAYAEDAQGSSMISPGVGHKIAEILIEHANRRFISGGQSSTGSPAPKGESFSPARQARRLRVPDGTAVTVDGASSFLVDLSVVGAQVLSPLAMRPNRLVQMTLSTDEGALACEGRVVWALFEQPRGANAARYRVGVKFTAVEQKAVESFLLRHGIDAPAREPAKLENTA